MFCLDVAPLIRGIQSARRNDRRCSSDKRSEEERKMVRRTQQFLQDLQESGKKVLVPAPVVLEYLAGVPQNRRKAHQELFNKLFLVPALDLAAASLAADLQNAPAVQEAIRADDSLIDSRLSTDASIVAIALVNNATHIITSNVETLRLVAQGRIKVSDVPERSDQRRFDF